MLEQFSMGKFVTYLESFFSLLLPRGARQFKVTPKGEASWSHSEAEHAEGHRLGLSAMGPHLT